MPRNYIGFNIDKEYVLETVNPTIGISSVGLNWGILDTSGFDLTYSKKNLLPYVVGSATSTSGGINVSSITFNTPTNSSGDLLLAFLATNNSNRTFSSSGWVVEKSTIVAPSFSVLSKTASESEPSPVTFTITGGTASVNGFCVSIKNWNKYYVSEFGAQNNSPLIPTAGTIPLNAVNNLLLFGIGNDGNGKSWTMDNIDEYTIGSLTANAPSLELESIYPRYGELQREYNTTQTGTGSNSHGISVAVANYISPLSINIVSSSKSITINTITLGTVNAGDLIVLFFENNAAITVPSGFTKIVSSETANPYLVVATKTAIGSETTLTGTWLAAASMVIKGITDVIGTPQGPTSSTVSVAPSITTTRSSLVIFWTVNNSIETVTANPLAWTLLQTVYGTRSGVLYAKYYDTIAGTGDVSATWTNTPVNAVLVSFILT